MYLAAQMLARGGDGAAEKHGQNAQRYANSELFWVCGIDVEVLAQPLCNDREASCGRLELIIAFYVLCSLR